MHWELDFISEDNFKKHVEIYKFLNSDSKNYQNMVEKVRNQPKVITNNFEQKGIFIILLNTITNWELINQKNSNMEELFDIITSE